MPEPGSGTLRVGVVGAAGYSGGELCRLLLGHPEVGMIVPTSRGEEDFERVHRNLAGSGLRFTTLDVLLECVDSLDAAFLCTPSGQAMRIAPQLLAGGARVVDLSADFRFPDAATYQRVYGEEHVAADLLDEAVCGITELYRDQIASARLVANPGCYVIAATLALVPLIQADAGDIAQLIHVSATNGTTGAGNSARKEVMHAEAFASTLPYNMNGHRHGPELETRLGELAGAPVTIDLSTAHGNFARGIYLHATLAAAQSAGPPLTRDALLKVYRAAYGSGHQREHFVIVDDLPRRGGLNAKEYDLYPLMGSVVGSNFCHIGVDYDEGRGLIKAMAAIDNLIKGAAGSAVQNMNVMLGIDERTGLRAYGL